MIPFLETPGFLLACVFGFCLSGIAVMTWGRKLPRNGDWLVGLGWLALVAALALGWSWLINHAFEVQTWGRGWIWPKDLNGAITVGVMPDAIGLSMAALTALISLLVLVDRAMIAQEPRSERFYASVAISCSGVALAWISLTPWLALMGLTFTVFGGFIALGSRWESEPEAALATRFGWERSWGLVLAMLGGCVLAGSRAALSWASGESWSGISPEWNADWIGALVLAVGLFIQFQPFPFLGWLVSQTQTPPLFRFLQSQIFPAWAAFAIFLRLEPQLRAMGLFPMFGWVALASAVLAMGSGFFHSHWKMGIGTWISSGLSIALAILAFTGPYPALSVLIGVSLGAMALAGSAGALETGGTSSNSNRQRAIWAKVGCFAGAAAGTGLVGFASAGGGIRWVAQSWDQPAIAAVFLVILLFYTLLGWKLAWSTIQLKNYSQVGWYTVISPLVLVVLSLGIVWSGTVTGGIVYGSSDQVMPSLLAVFFPSATQAGDEHAFLTATWAYLSAGLVGIAAAYWTSGRKQDLWQAMSKSLPATSQFFSSGYAIDGLVGKAMAAMNWLGRTIEMLVDREAWGYWLPRLLVAGVRRGSGAISAADSRISGRLGGTLRRWIDVPAKLLQLIQSGDVQWYIFFAVGSGIALLVHFFKI